VTSGWLLASFERIGWGIGYCLAPLGVIVICAVMLTGCGTMPRTRSPQIEVWDDMRRQEKFKPQQYNAMFSDQRASRRPPEGAIARGYLKGEDAMHTGLKAPDLYEGAIPVKVDAELLKLGQSRFNVYCTPCHDRAGTGKGAVALKTPTWVPSNLHEDRIKKMADGEIFHIITNGKRSMPPYRFQIQAEKDRWAIVSYVRAIQRMSSGSIDDVPAEMRSTLGDSQSQNLIPLPPAPITAPPADSDAQGGGAPPAPAPTPDQSTRPAGQGAVK